MSSNLDPAAWRIVSPAPRAAALALAGSHRRVRRGVLAQIRAADSALVYRGHEPMALAMFRRHGWRRTEMALAIAPAAAVHLGRLVRIAQLTLFKMAEDRIIVAFVDPANAAGRRMAMLIGMRRARLKSRHFWVYRRTEHDNPICRRRRRRRSGKTGVRNAATCV